MIDNNYGDCDNECMTTTMATTLYDDDIRRRNHFNNYDSYDYLYSFIWACMIILETVCIGTRQGRSQKFQGGPLTVDQLRADPGIYFGVKPSSSLTLRAKSESRTRSTR